MLTKLKENERNLSRVMFGMGNKNYYTSS